MPLFSKLGRNISTVTSELSLTGPKDSFTEIYDTNLGLIKKRITSTKLKLKELSMVDYIKVLVIRLVSKSCKTIVLKNIDISLNFNEQARLFNALRRNIKLVNKTIIFESMNIESIVPNSDYYVIVDDNKVIYSGDDFTKLPVKTEIMEIVDLANKKGAKLSYYKDINDLLKAIYRSVKQ